jgi:hypothetical protein
VQKTAPDLFDPGQQSDDECNLSRRKRRIMQRDALMKRLFPFERYSTVDFRRVVSILPRFK